MTIRFLEYKDYDNQDPDEAKYLAAYEEEHFEQIYKMLNEASKIRKAIVISLKNQENCNVWYDVVDFVYSPGVGDNLTCLNIYVEEKF